VSEGVVRRVENTTGLAQLDAWLDALAKARKRSDVSMPPLPWAAEAPLPRSRTGPYGMASFLVAVAFLTVLPVPFRKLPDPAAVVRSRFWYPVVGLLLGALLGGTAALLAAWLRSPLVAAFLLLAAWVGLTGALHLDGFCDLCDGLFAGRTPEDRLRILKDPHLGTFALAGGVLLLLGKFVALQALLAPPGRAPWVVAGAVTAARCLVVCVAAGARYPRPEGTGKLFIEATRPWEMALFGGLAAAVALATVGPLRAVPAFAGVFGLRWLCQRRLGGVTGDCLGAAIELAEVLFLLATAA
jgi:adenosylcobinamide-GDP ribazoletransferase